MNNDVFKRIEKFLITESLVDYIEITKDTTIEGDLGITGDDAYDILVKFSEVFNVNISNFDFKKYFHEEGDWVFGWLFKLLNRKNKVKKNILTVGDLEKAIELGKLE